MKHLSSMKQLSGMKQQSGFTLIELVMVIVILGILAATALPKFADLSTSARDAVVSATKGSLNSSATILYGQNKAIPSGASVLANIIQDGVTVTQIGATCGFNITPSGGTLVSYTVDPTICN